jgi:tetratricopeptide (TPR) repeat protein
MDEEVLKEIQRQAFDAHKAKRYPEEAKLWRSVYIDRPRDDEVLSNLASAEMLAGNLSEASELFGILLKRNSQLARAVNNYAGLRLRMGAELQDLFPDFMRAVLLSASNEEVCWHTISVCQCAAFGTDHGAPELFDAIDEQIMLLIDMRFFPVEKRQKEKKLFKSIINGYREVAKYRKAVANKEWGQAEVFIENAKKIFLTRKLHNFVLGLSSTIEDMRLCKKVFGVLECISIDEFFDPQTAWEQASNISDIIRKTRLHQLENVQRRLFQILDSFLHLFTAQLAYLSNSSGVYQRSDTSAETLIWLSASSFRRIGDDLLGIASFAEKRCIELSNRRELLASDAGIKKAAQGEWVKLALYVRTRILDIRDVDIGLARAALGWSDDPLGRVRADLHEFRAFFERQAHTDIFVDGRAQENIARALLQTSMASRSYREVPVRGGRSDILLFERDRSRLLIEVKIWRGPEYHEQGKREIAEYIKGENDDEKLLGVFYVVFDPTESGKAVEYEGLPITTSQIGGASLEIVIIRARPPQPSKIVK